MVIIGGDVNGGAMTLVVGSTGSLREHLRDRIFLSGRTSGVDEACRIDRRRLQNSKFLTDPRLKQ